MSRRTTRKAATVPAPLHSEARDDILRLQEALYRRQRRLIRERVTATGPEFKRYEARALARMRDHQRVVPLDDVVRAAAVSDIVHVGDYHTLKQAQRWFLKLVRGVAAAGRPVALALEFVEARHQPLVDRYLAGDLEETEFLEKTGYAQRFAFDVWPNFKPLFDTARELRLPIIGIERARGAGTLAARDRFFARHIARAHQHHPDAVVMVLAGQLHVAPPHLPAQLKRLTEARQLVVYQNAERIWFSLEKQGIEHHAEAVLVRAGEYCLINTSPVVAQQSYLDWVEDGELVETTQPERHFKELARLIASFLELPLGDALDEVSVYTAGDLSFLEELERRGDFTARELRLVRGQILARESYYIPRAKIAYLGGLSMNHAAEESAHFLRHTFAGELETEHGLVDAFYARAMEEAFAFFGSKIVNPKRKTAHEEEFERRRRSGAPRDRAIAELVLAHLALERGTGGARFRAAFGSMRASLFNDVTHALGYILGDRLYYALLSGLVTKAEARRLFCTNIEEDGEPIALYLTLSRRLANVPLPKRR